MVYKGLAPEMNDYLRGKMKEHAESYVLEKCCEKFKLMINNGPYKSEKGTTEIKVMSLVLWNDDMLIQRYGRVPRNSREITCVTLDANGTMKSHNVFKNFFVRNEKYLIEEDLELHEAD